MDMSVCTLSLSGYLHILVTQECLGAHMSISVSINGPVCGFVSIYSKCEENGVHVHVTDMETELRRNQVQKILEDSCYNNKGMLYTVYIFCFIFMN